MGPLGVSLAINTSTVEWLVNGQRQSVAAASIAARNRPRQWNDYRVTVSGKVFSIMQNGVPSGLDLVVGQEVASAGHISFHLEKGSSSDVAIRRIRVKQ
jgi:hypothetical protein